MSRSVVVAVDIGVVVAAGDTAVVAGIVVVAEDTEVDTAQVDNHNMEDIAEVEVWCFPPRL